MEEKYLSLDEIHEELLIMLEDFDALCKKLDIQYYLSGGSIIGAVRHKGFIPWDDDLDLMMLREDYEKLISNKNHLDKKYRLNSLETTENWQYPFAKIDLLSTYIKDDYRIVQHGLFLDIFPIDMLPDEKEKQIKIAKKIKYLDLLRGSGTKKKFRASEKYTMLKKIIRPYANLKGPTYFAKKIDKYAKLINKENQNSSTAGVMVVSTHGIKEFLPLDSFSSVVEVEFDGKTTFLFKGYKTYLENLYGDYMKLPPKDQQIPAHYKIYKDK